jgi:hypothetical protein
VSIDGLFVGALQSNATAGQFGYWLQKGALGMVGLIGCFAMTELGHGSNVSGLETTATFDEVSDQFVIHTPTLTATKWWIGGAAHSATHAAVFAQLVVKGKYYGTKIFVVPLRDPKTYHILPGVNIGDIGKKMVRAVACSILQMSHILIFFNRAVMVSTMGISSLPMCVSLVLICSRNTPNSLGMAKSRNPRSNNSRMVLSFKGVWPWWWIAAMCRKRL